MPKRCQTPSKPTAALPIVSFASFLSAGLVLAFSLTLPHQGTAQSAADCIAPEAQQLMNACAAKEYRQADAALNAAWKPARAFAKEIGQFDALLEAQRAWLAYRDLACNVQASPFDGGSLQPLIQYTCLSDLTAARANLLLEFTAY